jgi:hypothetical protein
MKSILYSARNVFGNDHAVILIWDLEWSYIIVVIENGRRSGAAGKWRSVPELIFAITLRPSARRKSSISNNC